MKPNVLVVGAGVIGCAMAHELALRGAAVTVLDSASVAAGVSSSTFPWVNASNPAAPEAYARLKVLGMRAHETSQRRSAVGGSWFHRVGNIQVAASDSDMAALEEKVQRLTARDYAARLLSAREVQDLEPSIEHSGLVGGALFPDEGWVDTVSMCTGLLHSAQALGAVFKPYQAVTEVAVKQVTCTSPDGAVHRYSPDLTVLAAGNGNRHILAANGIDFPLHETGPSDRLTPKYSGVGLVGTTSPVDSAITHMIEAKGVSLSPARNGGITLTNSGIGARWFDDPAVWEAPGVLLDRARSLFPSLHGAEIQTLTASTRVLPRDGATVADWVDSTRAVYAVATHSGVTLAPHLAEVVSEELLTGRRHESLNAFGLARFAN